jgi:hypothetical protein
VAARLQGCLLALSLLRLISSFSCTRWICCLLAVLCRFGCLIAWLVLRMLTSVSMVWFTGCASASLDSCSWRHMDPKTHNARVRCWGVPIAYVSVLVSHASLWLCFFLRVSSAVPRVLTTRCTLRLVFRYDPRDVPACEKRGCTVGMSMTEKQGGSDVRSNTTVAAPLTQSTGPGAPYSLTGHKWFTSAPMCDAFLTLANTPEGLSCFLVPRWLPDGSRNKGFMVMRLKDKLGDHSNASSEVEYSGAWGQMIGQPGKGVRTIVDMVVHTRLDCSLGRSVAGCRDVLLRHAHVNPLLFSPPPLTSLRFDIASPPMFHHAPPFPTTIWCRCSLSLRGTARDSCGKQCAWRRTTRDIAARSAACWFSSRRCRACCRTSRWRRRRPLPWCVRVCSLRAAVAAAHRTVAAVCPARPVLHRNERRHVAVCAVDASRDVTVCRALGVDDVESVARCLVGDR